MKSNKKFSRRGFMKGSIATGGVGILAPAFLVQSDCPVDAVKAPGPIPLNDVLTDYRQSDEKYGFGLERVTVCDQQGWLSKRESILQRSKIMLGEKPEVKERPLETLISEEILRNGYTEKKVQFSSGTGDIITGFLLVPEGATGSSPRPAVMALHSTGPGAGQAVGIMPKEGRCYGMELARRGYVVLAVDVISAGERIYPGYEAYYTDEFYKDFPQWSAMGKMIHDHQRGIDFLCGLNMVDSNRIGCIGHSLGGYNSFFLHAFDPRIKAAVSSCGLSPMGGSNSPYQFARNDWFVHFNPYCREFIRAGMIPCDMHEIMALCAPRPLFNYSARQDAIYCPSSNGTSDFDSWWQTVENALNQVEGVYYLTGKPEDFVQVSTGGGHDFPADIRTKAYDWLDRQLKVND